MLEAVFDSGTNIADWLYDILSFVGGEDGAGFIVLMLLLVCVLYIAGIRRRDFRNMLANAMTSLGILGTFCGIFIALQGLNFQPGDIEKDVFSLVRGMRVAFVTSLIGIGATLLSRATWRFWNQKKTSPSSPDQNIAGRLDAIKNAIAGDGDSSMVAQMQELRNENRKGFKKLDGVSEKIDSVSEETRNALIARLESVKSAIAGDGDLSVTAQMQKLHDENRERFEKIDSMSEEMRKALVAHLESVKNAIAGDSDLSVAAQVDKLRDENWERFEKIDSMSEETRKALVAHLESVKSAIAGDSDLSVAAQMGELRDENRERFEKIDSMSEETRKTLVAHLESVKNAIAGDSDLSVVAQVDKLRDENRGEFKKLDGLTEEMRKALVDRLESVKSAIAGDGDSSMTAQMDKLRDENREGFKKLDGLTEEIRNALVKNIAELIAKIQEEIANKLVKSVVDLTEEIRRAFSDHLGKAFEDFNAAAQAIKKWQEDHRQHVEQLTEAFEKSAQGIERIRADCESIPKTMGDLRAMVEAANVQQKELAEHLRVFANLKTEAEKSFPTIKSHLDKIGADLASSAESFDGLGEKIQTVFQLAEKATKRVAEQHAENVEKMAGNMREKMEKAQRDASAGVQESVNQLMQQLTAEVSHLTKEWGGNLLSIAEQCAKTIRRVREQTDQ